MSYNFLDKTGLAHLWNRIKSTIFSENLFIKETAVERYITAEGGLATPDQYNMTSDFIEVTPGEYYTFSMLTEDTSVEPWSRCAWYDDNKNYVSLFGASKSNYNYKVTVQVPQNVKYARLSARYLQTGHELSKIKFEKGKLATDYTRSIKDKTKVMDGTAYSGIYGSANDQAGASFYFGGIRPDTFYQMWRIKFRVYSNVPNQNEYVQYSEVEYYGNKSDIGYMIFNRISNTSGRCFYYNNVCRLNATGFNAGYSHILGIGLRNANNPTSSSYPRNFRIEILETENCQFTFYSTMRKIANITEYNSTNYAGITEYDGANNGLRETGDDVNIWQLRHSSGNYTITTNMYRYMLCLQKNETNLIPINSADNNTGTSKTLTTDTFNPFGQILYYNSTTAASANTSVGAWNFYDQISLDLRYSFNTGTTLTAHKDVYIVAVPQSNGTAKLHTTPITQTLPTSEDGLIYIYLGRAYSTYQVELYSMHPVYEYKNGSLGLYSKYEYYARNLTPVSICGSDSANTAGWYKIASSVMSSWGNTNILYFVKDGYASGQTGILDLEMRSDNTSIACWQVRWLTRHVSLPADSVRIVIDGMTWTMYFRRLTSQYGRVYFTEISHRGIGGGKPSYNVTYYNSSAPEQEAPSTNIISSDGGAALRATGDKNGDDITTTYYKASNPNGYTSNTGTVTSVAVKMNGSTKGTVTTNGTIDLGTVLTSHQDISGKTNTSVMPNDNGEIKTKYRIANKDYTGNGNPVWYYPLCKLPTDNNGNYASAIISGRIGGWVSANMSYISALAWNRSGTGISLFDIAGSASNMSSIWGTCDIVIYTDAETVSTTANDNGQDIVYLKCSSYFTFDLDLEMFQSGCEILYDGSHITTTPTGTLVAQASTSIKRAELINGKLYVAGKELANTDVATTSANGLMSATDKTKLNGIAAGATANTGTVTSVAVKMNNTTKGTVTTSGTIDLGTVITSHQDISGKQDKLATQTAYTSKGSATKVPQITTNTLGQVTGISEVTISQPTVNNGTLTIQKNGTNVQTFSANQSGNATANITVPTKVSELTNDSGYTSNTGTITGVSVNSTSIATSGVANIVTNTAYNSSSNKIATMTDVYNNKGAETPVGTIFAYVAEEPPTGYLLCDGSAVSRTTYDELFDVIGTTYGSGDGSTTFNLPDLRRRHALMKGASDSLGNTGGSEEIFALANPTGGGMNYSNAGRAFNTDYWIDGSGGSKGGGGRANSNAGIRIRGAEDTSSSRESYLICNYIIKAYSGTDAPLPVDTSFVKNVSDDSTVNTYSTNYINTKVKGKKLWENPNPTSNFAAQTITFDGTNDYDFYKIKIGFATDSGTGTNWQDVEVGDTFSLLLMWSYTPGIADPNTKGYIATGFRPECSCNHSSITFTNAVYYTSADSTKLVNNTSHCIPLEIYGYYI